MPYAYLSSDITNDYHGELNMCPEMFRRLFLFLHGLILYSHNSSEKDKGRPLRASASPSQPVTP